MDKDKKTINNIVREFYYRILDLFFPYKCPLCHNTIIKKKAQIDDLFSIFPICKDCTKEIKRVESPLCLICGKPFKSKEIRSHLCQDCTMASPPFWKARSLFVYEGIIKQAIIRFKFYGEYNLAIAMSHWLLYLFNKEFVSEDIDCIIPVPLHIKRLRKRGYNQALLLGKEIAKISHIPISPHILKRIRWTEPQVNLNRTERLKNVKGAFQVVKKEDILSKKILLIDDVLTTGATIKECAIALTKAGASSIYVLTLAR